MGAICANDGDFIHQPIPSNSYENDFFFNVAGARNDRDMWLGITDSEVEGNFAYLTNQRQTTKFKASGKPRTMICRPTSTGTVTSQTTMAMGRTMSSRSFPATPTRTANGTTCTTIPLHRTRSPMETTIWSCALSQSQTPPHLRYAHLASRR